MICDGIAQKRLAEKSNGLAGNSEVTISNGLDELCYAKAQLR